MVVVMKPEATEEQIEEVNDKLIELGFEVHFSKGVNYTILGAIGDKRGVDPRELQVLNDGIKEVIEVSEPYKLASRTFHPEDTQIRFENGVVIGDKEIVLMAGPCAIETEEQVHAIASLVAKSGATILRGGAFKPRTSPYSFQGLGQEGLKYMREAADGNGLLMVTEVMDRIQVELVSKYTDILQIGARNMQNFNLLKEVGDQDKPVLLKRGLSATVKELLMAAEYVMSEGNRAVILCERGIRTFADHARFTLDLSSIPFIKDLSHLPIIVDPSHGMGIQDKVIPMARAGIAAGADGLIIEVHHQPHKALCDGPQALTPEQFGKFTQELTMICEAIGKKFSTNSRR